MSAFFPKRPVYVGIDGTTLSSVQIRAARKGWEVLSLSDRIVSRDAVLISALPPREVLVRHTKMQVKKRKELLAALSFQIEPLLPYPIENAILQAEPAARGNHVTVFATRIDMVERHLETLREEGIEPERVTCTPYALAALSKTFEFADSPLFLVHEGRELVTCILVDRGNLIAARAFDRSEEIGLEVHKTALSFAAAHRLPIEAVYLIGKGREAIGKATNKEVRTPRALGLRIDELEEHAVALGAALSATGPDFRQKTLVYPYQWRRIKKPLTTFFLCTALLIGSCYGWSKVSFEMQQKKIAALFTYLSETPPPTSAQGYLQKLNGIEQTIRAEPELYPLVPNLPTVHELLGWLTALEPKIEITSLNYKMVKRPDLSHPKQHYQVKVDVEFTAKSPAEATAFHEELLAPNPIINASQEISWQTGKGKYRTSFFLKDKTRYW